MNFKDLQEQYFRNVGANESSKRLDWYIQQSRDDLNFALDEIVNSAELVWHHVRKSTVAIVVGTNIYNLDDFCKKPISFWTEDESAHRVDMVDPTVWDWDGSRSTSALAISSGPNSVAPFPKTTASAKSGTVGAVTEATTAFTKTGDDSITSSEVGRRIRLNGEDMDYTVKALVSSDAVTLDRSYKARLTGVAQGGTGTNLSGAKWEIGPPGIYRIELEPDPSDTQTLHYRFIKRHARMANDDDVPDLPERYHSLVLWRAVINKAIFTKDSALFGLAKTKSDSELNDFLTKNRLQLAGTSPFRYDSLMNQNIRKGFTAPDTSVRGAMGRF